MKNLLTIFVFSCCYLPFNNAQTITRGFAFSPSLLNIDNKVRDWCFSNPSHPLAADCVIDASNGKGLQLNYWKRFEGKKLPFFAEGRMGLRYFGNELNMVEYTREAEAPSIILKKREKQENLQSLFLHFSMTVGCRFQVGQVAVRPYGGVYADKMFWGKRKLQTSDTHFYNYTFNEDRKLIKTLLEPPITEPTVSSEAVEVSSKFIDKPIGGVFGIDVDLPIRSKYRFSIGYNYGSVWSQKSSYRHQLEDFHNLNLTVGLAKNKENKNRQSVLSKVLEKGFVIGTHANLLFYEDGYTTNMIGFDLAIGYNTKKGIRPEGRLSMFREASGKEADGIAAGGGLAFSAANGYIVPRVGFTYALWWEWSSELTNKSTGIYGGAGFQYPNSGRLRMEISILSRVWLNSAGNSAFRPLMLGCGVNYFFGES